MVVGVGKWWGMHTSILRPSTTVPWSFSRARSASALLANVTKPNPCMPRQKGHGEKTKFTNKQTQISLYIHNHLSISFLTNCFFFFSMVSIKHLSNWRCLLSSDSFRYHFPPIPVHIVSKRPACYLHQIYYLNWSLSVTVSPSLP